MKRFLCVVSRAPYESSHSFELLETALVGAVFDLDVALLFRDDGVYCLLKEQDASSIGRKTVSKTLAALETYDIEKVFVCKESLRERNITAESLCLAAEQLGHAEQGELLRNQDAVVGAQS